MANGKVNTIMEQLGGGRFIAMTGARDFIGDEPNAVLAFALPGRLAAKGINKVRVTLTPADLYTVEFFKLARRGLVCETVETVEGVYADQLGRVFESVTGLAVSL